MNWAQRSPPKNALLKLNEVKLPLYEVGKELPQTPLVRTYPRCRASGYPKTRGAGHPFGYPAPLDWQQPTLARQRGRTTIGG